ncbi:MAG: lipid export permease/ATP-binding protein MsbA [Pseudomonadota bacterium]|jgi:subfamily B ATP-binding cassette protein MsbA
MNSKTLYLRLLRYVRPYWKIFSLSIFAMIIVAISEPALPALLQPLLDIGFVEKNGEFMRWMPVILMGLITVKGLATLVSGVGITWIASRLVMDLRVAMFDKILTLPTTEFDNTSSGVLLSKITYDVNRVMAASTEVLIVLIRDSISIIGLLAWMFYLNWFLTLIVFTIVPLLIVTIRSVSKKLRGINTTLQDTMGDMTRILEEAISGHKLVKVFGGYKYEHQRFHVATDQVRHLSVKTEITSEISVFIIQFLTAAALSVIIYIASQQSAANAISVGGFVSLFTAMGMIFAPLKRLTKVNDQLQQGLAAAQSIFELLDKKSETDTGTQALQKLSGKISLCHLSFAYQAKDNPALRDLNLNIAAGETIALVGASGSGKTTLANLIPRFYSLPDGKILFDDMDINQLPLSKLRENIALVSQEVVLFNDSVAANIAYGALTGVTKEKIIAAADAAYALEFINKMPEGFDTMVGERGVKLSGGQRQRIAIARALLKDAPILIFDEATSALDTQSEFAVQQALERLKAGRTVIIIAHRLSTIANADRIVVLDKGKVVEIGKHAELLERQGVYANLYRTQFVAQGME